MLRSSLAAAALACAAGAAHAQTTDAPPADIPQNFLSAGAAMLPDYPGSDDYRVIPFGAARLVIGDVVVQTEGPGLAATLAESGPVEFGVFGRWYGGREDDIDDAVVRLLPTVDDAIVAGGFARATLAENVLGRDRVSADVRVGADVTDTFDGAIWTTSLSYGAALPRGNFLALSASLTGVSDDYADLHFSVDPAGAAASGLPVFAAESGVRDIGVTAIYDQAITRNWSATAVLGYSRLIGDFADSPLVSIRGSEDQAFFGLAIGRRF
ncbi:MipA/OmpV family protein [Marinicauda salina]|nr:MipA/OmpV family protein [Marinicauda salina]